MFLLRPDRALNDAILYALAVAAERHSIEMHWALMPTNHEHLGATDRLGNLPNFLRDFHHWAAKLINHRWNRRGPVWDSIQTNVVDLITPEDAFGKQIYSVTNPVKDQLVEKTRDWPGINSLDLQLCDKEITLKRPAFFKNDGTMPETVKLRFTRPPGFEHLTARQWADKVTAAIQAEELKAEHVRIQRGGKKVLGRAAVLNANPFHVPDSKEERRRTLRPTIACKNPQLRRAAIARSKQWLADYNAALTAYRAGNKSALFPHGTWQLRIDTHVQCAPGPGPLGLPYAARLRAA